MLAENTPVVPAPALAEEAVPRLRPASQYCSRAYRAVLAQHGFRESMSRKGDCWDNAVVESFFATLEHELLALETFATKRDAQHALFDFIEVWYNRQRRHTSLGSISPVEYEAHQRAA